jgi:hypothetical protein
MATQDAFTTDEWTQLRLVPSLVAGKASPAEAEAYRTMLIGVSEQAANASKEGGFLGFGGVRVSDKERSFISEVKAAAALALPNRQT